MEGPILVILAAGMGSRYGGLKQMDAFGEGGEAILDYSVFDALRSGFKKVVFIIRRDIEADFRSCVLGRMEGKVSYELAFQQSDSLIPSDIASHAASIGRSKPWGTAHALLCAEPFVNAPFAVLNADDFYGREAFAAIAPFLAGIESGVNLDGALVPYALHKTLSPLGTVTRGVCTIEGGYLRTVNELKAIEAEKSGGDAGKIYNTEGGKKTLLAADTPVSMNFWGFPAAIFPKLHQYFDAFLGTSGREAKSECYLPLFADWMIGQGFLKVRSLSADADWFGVTYKEDKDTVAGKIADLTAKGVYPRKLWE